MNKPIISFKDFTFKYLTQAEPTLKNIDLEIMADRKSTRLNSWRVKRS